MYRSDTSTEAQINLPLVDFHPQQRIIQECKRCAVEVCVQRERIKQR
jgi:hypothetical protein